MIDDEVEGAIEYAECAVMYKDEHEDLARTFADLAEQELKHVSRLHEAVVDLINQARDEGKTIPTGMMEMYEYLHKRQIEKTNEARNYLSQFKA